MPKFLLDSVQIVKAVFTRGVGRSDVHQHVKRSQKYGHLHTCKIDVVAGFHHNQPLYRRCTNIELIGYYSRNYVSDPRKLIKLIHVPKNFNYMQSIQN